MPALAALAGPVLAAVEAAPADRQGKSRCARGPPAQGLTTSLTEAKALHRDRPRRSSCGSGRTKKMTGRRPVVAAIAAAVAAVVAAMPVCLDPALWYKPLCY